MANEGKFMQILSASQPAKKKQHTNTQNTILMRGMAVKKRLLYSSHDSLALNYALRSVGLVSEANHHNNEVSF